MSEVETMQVKLDLKDRKDKKLLKKLQAEGWEIVYQRDMGVGEQERPHTHPPPTLSPAVRNATEREA